MLVLFDFDGTLVDSRARVLAAMGGAFAEHSLDAPDSAAIIATVGLQPEDMLRDLCPSLGDDMRRALAESYLRHAIASRTTNPNLERPYDGAAETLARLRGDGHRLGVVTGKSARGLDQCLGHLDWTEVFDTLQPADGAPGKPDPTLILRAMAAMEADRDETVMIGDTSFDMIMAQRAGVRAIGVSWGYHPAERLAAAGADRIVGQFSELHALL